MNIFDVIIIGAGASGLMATSECVTAGRRTLVLDMGDAPARKVRISGGGRCNITNMAASRNRYFGINPDFVRGILARVSPSDILAWADQHNLAPRESSPGRFFCDAGAAAVVDALWQDAQKAKFIFNTMVVSVSRSDDLFTVTTARGNFTGRCLIVATGGVSYANLGVSDLGYKIAKQFGHKIIPVRPGLGPIITPVMDPELAGISLNVAISVAQYVITDAMLMTHNGIGGPAAYRASLHDLGDGIRINFCPGPDIRAHITTARQQNGRRSVSTWLGTIIPARLARWIAGPYADVRIADLSTIQIKDIVDRIENFTITGDQLNRGSFATAEVTYGGIDTQDISPRTLESKRCPGLFFAGEVLDITGDLGGFNLQWAWATGRIAGQSATDYTIG